MKKVKKSITVKFILMTLLAVIPVVVAITYISYRISDDILLSQTREQAKLIVKSTIEKMNLITGPIEKVPASVAENLPDTPDAMVKLLKIAINTNTNIFGMAAAFEPHAFNPKLNTYCPYVYKKDGKIQLTRLDTPAYDYLHSAWYTVPKKLDRPVWSEPYFDKGGGNILMSTYSIPVHRNGKFIGILTADFSLKNLDNIVRNIHVLQKGYAFLVSAKGVFLSSPDKTLLGKSTVLDYAGKAGSKTMQIAGRKLLTEKSGFLRYLKDGKAYRVFFRPIPSTGWIIGLVFPEDELFAPLHHLARTSMITAFLGILFIVLVVSIVSRKSTSRIMKLSEIAETISTGNLNTEIPADTSGDELGTLASTLDYMQKSLRQYIEDLKTATAKKQRIESELNIAREIQMGILPKIFPPFPEEKDIDVYAMIEPAREVGGDLYDFFFVDPEHFCFLIGDVSGKGVPASLFMAVAKTLIKAIASTGKSSGETLEIVNNELSANNSNCMFVTVFIGILDIRTGEIQFTSAGHNPPAHIGPQHILFVSNSPSPALGVFPDVTYSAGTLKLAHGESLFLYTDGVNEAFNPDGKQYSMERLEKILNRLAGEKSEKIIQTVFQDIKVFVRDAEQSDDITMLNIRYTG